MFLHDLRIFQPNQYFGDKNALNGYTFNVFHGLEVFGRNEGFYDLASCYSL